ncbi:type II toxin-antitoxin system ParD family antitoxin [Methyloraptor flagellatus]|uniref:Type II toxin-antitoxin system ParD family antitoxin n=1 Tax=Methyloraptor flagellatus TaxID=3162530 RepID=A0AAU7XAM7_9HYPH
MKLNVALSDDLAAFVEAKVASGRYGTSADVVREALRLMEFAEARAEDRIMTLREQWDEGIASGDAGEIDFEVLKREARRRLGAEG